MLGALGPSAEIKLICETSLLQGEDSLSAALGGALLHLFSCVLTQISSVNFYFGG